MQVEQLEILDFLTQHEPFSKLDEAFQQKLATSIDVRYYKAGTPIIEVGTGAENWHIIRSGAVEIFRRSGVLYNRLTEGGHFGEFGLLRSGRVRFPATAIEDSLIYLVPPDLFHELYENDEVFADYVELVDRNRLHQAVSSQPKKSDNPLMNVRTIDLLDSPPVLIGLDVSADEAARRLLEDDVSSLLVIEKSQSADPDQIPRVVGILSDRDLCTRLIAAGLDNHTPVREIMTPDPISLRHDHLVFEAMMQMVRHKVRHLPVFQDDLPIGILSLLDIVQYEARNSLFVVASISRQPTAESLATLASQTRACFTYMVSEGANSRAIEGSMSLIGRAFKQRLLELAEEQLGPPPVPYCFIALGSMARNEQSIVTDQDNALILDDRFDVLEHDEYFQQLATFVSDGLAASGYSYCTGQVMATNPRWRQPLKVWKEYFTEWIEKPTPQSLLDSGIFFDLDAVWGENRWARELNTLIARKARQNSRFLACMARNALLRTPPLGFFKNFVMESDGKHSNTVNMKRRGTAPLVDLIRVHALAVGSRSNNSFERLRDIIKADILPQGRGQDLIDALEFISMVRIRHQAEDIEMERTPNNSVQPENLSEFERKNLRDAFLVLSNAQKFLRYRYQPGRSN